MTTLRQPSRPETPESSRPTVALFPKSVIIAIGGNDSGGRVTAPRTRANLDKLVSMFTSAICCRSSSPT
jgi:lysophospholipase L1-like esterase